MKTSIGYLEMDALTAEPSDVLASRYGFCIVSGTPYYWDGSAWNAFATSGGSEVGTMEDTYENGRTIGIDTGAIVLNDATTAALNTLELNKNGAGSGNVINIDMNLGIAAGGIYIDTGAGARTGADILINDESTGTHIAVDINSSGSGASTGLAWTESYNGNGGKTGVNLTLDANDGLTSTAIAITRGAGIRTVGAIDINDGSTGSGDLIDIDLTGVYTGNVIDFASSAAATGNVLNIDLDNAVAMTAIHLEGSGVRTQPMVEMNTDCTGSSNVFSSVITGAISGNVFDISIDTTVTGDVVVIDMNAGVAARAFYIDSGAATRTAVLIDILADGDGDVDVFNIDESNDGSGNVFDINVSGIGSGNVIDVTYSAADTGDALKVVMADNVAGGALVVTGAGARTDSLIDVVSAETGSIDGMVYFGTSGVFTGSILKLHSDGASTTGSLLHIDLDAGVAYKAITFDQAGARTSAVVLATFDGTFGSGGGGTFLDANISMTGASASSFIDIDVSAIYTGDIIDIALGAASTGTVMDVDMNLGVAARFLTLDAGAVTRTVPMMVFTFDGAGTTVGGTLMDINVTNTGAASSPLFDIDVTAIYTGNIFDIVFGGASASTGDALHVDMGTNLAGGAIQIDAAGARTAPLIYIANVGTDAGTDDHVMFVYQTGALDSNLIQLTYATAASAGNALSIAMGTNVAGMALDINSSGTGVNGEGSAIDITHDGVLVAGADIVSIKASGAISSTSNALSIATIGDAGSYGLYINATGSAEAIKVDAGTVTFDETLTVTGATALVGAVTLTAGITVGGTLAVTGATTLSSTLSYRHLIEDTTATNTITAAESGTVFFLNSGTEFVSTLPALAAGLHFTFIVKAAPSGASYTVVTNSSANIIIGLQNSVAGDGGDSGTTDDTISFVDGQSVVGDKVEVFCDGTYWYAYAISKVAAGITFTTAS